MNRFNIFLAILLHIFLVAGASTPLLPETNATKNAPVEKFTLAPGVMVNTLDPDYLPVQESTKNPRSTLHRRRTHVKDIMMTLGPRADKPVCSREKPWLCEGKTCMNKYFQLCCKGGGVCDSPKRCVMTLFNTVTCG
ncbi:hypothetical protein BDBG_06057 [Blastomyces gilchristii SLH14081]|uniref:Uncharacterized protein n=1 Tax=Blastomyces gilchristii (strain SLH14081) TaxID=559298 RepID=A0A179UTH5_BLAGS|nr:uncharacterized protein BDBG_06057 [Blastomyces gilchristii SLH14081]OAT11093.1 hypothetical protein BDBG_06057 [Blastomyces gilchristii SLH14081]